MGIFIKRLILFFSPIFFFFFGLFHTTQTFAHEQYVLTQQQLTQGFADKNTTVLSVFQNPEDVRIGILVSFSIVVLIVAYFFFQYSRIGKQFNALMSKLDPIGHVFLRVALAASLLTSAYFHAFLGPEIPAGSLPLGGILVPILFVTGILLLFGIFTRIAAAVGLITLVLTTFVYGEYMLTYFNYFGEYLALLIFGSYVLSVDNKLFGISRLVKRYKDWEIFLIRVTYGISVMYPAITIKLLHPAVIVEIVNKYQLNQIHWLFPQDPLLISLGTGVAQILVGVFIIIGFETRLASLVTFFLYFLSVLYFKEAVWPHYVLLALAGYLVINNGGAYTFDRWLERIGFPKKHRK